MLQETVKVKFHHRHINAIVKANYWWVTIHAKNGKNLFTSEVYKRRRSCITALKALQPDFDLKK